LFYIFYLSVAKVKKNLGTKAACHWRIFLDLSEESDAWCPFSIGMNIKIKKGDLLSGPMRLVAKILVLLVQTICDIDSFL